MREMEIKGLHDAADARQHLHALVIPHPLQGHITPLLQLSHKLASSYGLSITFVLTEHSLKLMGSSSNLAATTPELPIRFIGLPDGLPDEHPRRSAFLDAYEGMMGLQAATDDFLRQLAEGHHHHHPQLPSFILADTFVIWAHELGQKYGIPNVGFVTTNISAMAVMASTSKLIRLGILPLKTLNGSSKYPDEPITCIPGVPPLHPSEMPMSMRSPNLDYYRMKFVIAQFEQASKGIAVLLNSVYEIEKEALDGLEIQAPVYPVGPSLILNGESSALNGIGGSLWPEQSDCLSWLDQQAPASVLYVSFGSMATLGPEQSLELAMGLEASQQPFLWVIRPGSYEGGTLSDILPAGFLEKVKGRGSIVSWAPQLRVLAHPATGGFLTHCGWNSVMENLCLGGVPMICWPDAAEQAVNARVIIDVWKVGRQASKGQDGIVRSDEMQQAVKAVMQGEQGKDFRSKARELKETVNRAVQKGGSSLKNMERLLETVRQAMVKQSSAA